MAKSVTINKGSAPYKSMDYEALFKEGVGQHIPNFSGRIWTDYNVHDPGITMLEYLCFGLTDISYRCSFPIAELLYARENRRIATVNNAFFLPEEILPCAAIVPEDYRKLIIDGIREVDNVWFEPVTEDKEKFKGLYDVRLQINTERQKDRSPEAIKEAVATLLAANRNLCEDIRDIYVLEQQDLEIEAMVDLENDASAEQVLADIIHELDHFLAPKVTFYDPEEMLAAGADINALFDGPVLEQGYIDTTELRSQTTEINISQLRDTIISTSGVRSIAQIRIKLNGLPQFSDEIVIPANAYFVLHESMRLLAETAAHPLKFRRNNQPLQPNYFQAWQILSAKVARESQTYRHNQKLKSRSTAVEKDMADIGAYYSIQRFFPAVYGIGTYGLPWEATLLRKAQSRQLKGYLAIFETMFSSYLRQLTQVRHLFSIEDEDAGKAGGHPENAPANRIDLELSAPPPSYFASFPFDIPDIDSLILFDGRYKREEIEEKLVQNTALYDEELDRRNMFLDHLLARFSESVSGEWLNPFISSPDDLTLVKKSLIKTKCRMLQDYVALGRDRGKGYDYSKGEKDMALHGTTNVSGLKKKLSYLINLPSYADRRLTAFSFSDQFEIKEVKASSKNDVQNKGWPLKSILRHGWLAGNYAISQSPDGDDFEVQYLETVNGKAMPHLLFKAETFEKAQQRRDDFIERLRQFDRQSRGFFIVEHLLLRPMRRPGVRLILDTADLARPSQNNTTEPVGQQTPATTGDPEKFEFYTGEHTFETLEYTSLEALKGVAEDLLLVCSDLDNFKVLPDGDQFFIVITQNKQPLLVSTHNYTSREAANRIRQEVKNRVKEALKNEPNRLSDWIRFDNEQVKGMDIDNAFYSHRISIVLPDWPNFFMDPGFQLWFKEIVTHNLPAHLRADLLWLNWAEMKDFEEIYMQWLNVKSNPNSEMEELDDLSFQLAEKLEPRMVAQPAQNETRQHPPENVLNRNRVNALIDEFDQSFLFKPTELQILHDIDENLEYWLKKKNVGTWSLLSVASVENLEKAGLKASRTEIESWKKQARMAADGKWADLEREQRRINREQGFVDVAETKLHKLTIERMKKLLGNQP